MAEIRVTNDELIVDVKGFDKVLALHGNLTVSLSRVTGADANVEEAMKIWVGMKVAGSGIPGIVRAGTWAEGDGLVFWDVHDPALAARLLGVDEGALLSGASAGPSIPRDGTLLGALFESLVTLSVRAYAQAAEASVHHLRTSGGDHEIDLIVQRADQRLVALEVKLAASVVDADVRHLHWLKNRIGSELLDAAVITTSSNAYRRPDGIAVIPAALLGP